MSTIQYPIESYSWEVYSGSVAIKRLDKSAFLHHGSGIPKDIAFFFNLEPDGFTEARNITLTYSGQRFPAHFQMDTQRLRYRLFWKSTFSGAIKSKFPDIHQAYLQGEDKKANMPFMRFEKLSENDYLVNLILPDIVIADVALEITQDSESRIEGGVTEFYGKRYERDSTNRREAIAIHA